MGEQESALSFACSLTVSLLLTSTLVCLNIIQTLTLGNLFSPMIWLKSIVCALPLSLSIFLLVPMLSGKSVPSRTRLSMVAALFCHPLQAVTFAAAGMFLHYLLPILNPVLDFPTEEPSLKLYLISSGVFSGLYFYRELFTDDAAILKYPTYRIGWPTRLILSIMPVVEDSLRAGWMAFRIFIPIWIVAIYIFSLSLWMMVSPMLHLKVFMMFFLTQTLLRTCLCLTRLIATTPRIFMIDSPLANDPSLIHLLESQNELEKLSAFQDLAILSRYADPRRSKVFELSVPGGKPKTWNAIWRVSFGILNDFASKIDSLTVKKSSDKTPVKPKPKVETFSTPIAKGTPDEYGRRFLWSKQSSTNSPPRNCSFTQTQTITASSVFQSLPEGQKSSFTDRLNNMFEATKLKMSTKFSNITESVSSQILSFRPIEFWIEVRPEYSALSLLSNNNSIRLSMISLSNIMSAAPADDKYGVTLDALPKLIRILSKITKSLDRLCRNNQQRSELRKLRNEARTALGKITAAYGKSLEELNIEK